MATIQTWFQTTFWEPAYNYLAHEWQERPHHIIAEAILALLLVWLLQRKSYNPEKTKMSRKEEELLLEEWTPEPLVPVSAEPYEDFPVVTSSTGAYVEIDGQKHLNFASYNFLGLANRPEIKKVCRETIDICGVGSCGPRGFYGSFDLHMNLERKVAEFLGCEEAILYSDALACLCSVLPAYAKRGDVVVYDETVNFGFQQAISLSRATAIPFKHNDMEDLERVLKEHRQTQMKNGVAITNKYRCFILVESISSQYGDLCPLPKLIELSKKYYFRLVVDDTLGFGVLGKTGKGVAEHFGANPKDIDILIVAADTALASVGALCVGSREMVDHQRLSGAGYCYSASAPPFCSAAALKALEILQEQPELPQKLQELARFFRQHLKQELKGLFTLDGVEQSPIIHLRLVDGPKPKSVNENKEPEENKQQTYFTYQVKKLPTRNDFYQEQINFLKRIEKQLQKKHQCCCFVPHLIVTDKLTKGFHQKSVTVNNKPVTTTVDPFPVAPSLRLLLTLDHSQEDLIKATKFLKQTFLEVKSEMDH